MGNTPGGVDKQTTKPVSLNLGMAVGLVAYELFNHIAAAQNKDPVIRGFNSHRLTVGERGKLIDDDMFGPASRRLVRRRRRRRGYHFRRKGAKVYNERADGRSMSSRDVTPLFMLARRAIAMAELADAEQKSPTWRSSGKRALPTAAKH